MKIIDLNIVNGSVLPIVQKTPGLPAYLFNPQHTLEEICTNGDKFMVPYYKIGRADAVAWLTKMEKSPPNPMASYEGVLLTYHDNLLGEPRYGAGIYRVFAPSN
jgi:hypothetical protein